MSPCTANPQNQGKFLNIEKFSFENFLAVLKLYWFFWMFDFKMQYKKIYLLILLWSQPCCHLSRKKLSWFTFLLILYIKN